MRKAVILFTLVVATIGGVWWWLGAAVPMPASPLAAGEKLYCVSYAPFRGRQTPLDLSTKIEPWQIEEDLAQLSKLTDCVRIYSVDFGLERVPEVAEKHGLQVLLGLWVSGHADRTKYQIDTGIALAKRFPQVIRAVVVGNEALLRGEIAPAALAELLRTVKSQVAMPVTYADVWEFWLRHRELANVVDFVTVHILPYWEDHPIAAEHAAAHVDSIRKQVAAQFEGKEVLIGEVGWPSAGRMRAGALPSPANQARVLHDILARGKQESFRVNIIEAFDQPWKRFLEGTVGGHWGILTDAPRAPKFVWGRPVSNHPYWAWQAAGGVVLAALVFGAALAARRGSGELPASRWAAIAAIAATAGVLSGWAVANVPLESLSAGDWLRSLAFVAIALAAPIACAAALATGTAIPSFARLIGPAEGRARGLSRAIGWLLLGFAVLAVQAALALAFDPRYRDFPFAPLTCAAVAYLLLGVLVGREAGPRPRAESVAAIVLVAASIAVAIQEGPQNWQALWTCAALLVLAFTLARARAVPG
jgi:exo-beta-1,3-glucanase (GH17 family)